MSWRCSITYWACGSFTWHVFRHALDPKQRQFYVLGWGTHSWQLWPPRSVLDPDREWTLPDEKALREQILHCCRLLERRL